MIAPIVCYVNDETGIETDSQIEQTVNYAATELDAGVRDPTDSPLLPEPVTVISNTPGARFTATMETHGIPGWIRGGDIVLMVDRPGETGVDNLFSPNGIETNPQVLCEWAAKHLRFDHSEPEQLVVHGSGDIPDVIQDAVRDSGIPAHTVLAPFYVEQGLR